MSRRRTPVVRVVFRSTLRANNGAAGCSAISLVVAVGAWSNGRRSTPCDRPPSSGGRQARTTRSIGRVGWPVRVSASTRSVSCTGCALHVPTRRRIRWTREATVPARKRAPAASPGARPSAAATTIVSLAGSRASFATLCAPSVVAVAAWPTTRSVIFRGSLGALGRRPVACRRVPLRHAVGAVCPRRRVRCLALR